MARRSKARQVVLQMLFQCDLNADVGPHTVRAMINEQIEDRSLRNFSWSLYSGVMENRNAIDARIQRVAQNWSLDRMAPTDRNVLRMCVFEMLYSDTPPPVAVDEAIDLARTFGTNQSAPFVNGLLDQLMPGARPAARQATETDSAAAEPSPPQQEPVGDTSASDRGQPDPRRRMAGHNAQLTPSVPGMKAYIQEPGVPLSMTPQTPPPPSTAETEAEAESEVEPASDSPAAVGPEGSTTADDDHVPEAAAEAGPAGAPLTGAEEEVSGSEIPQTARSRDESPAEKTPPETASAASSPADSEPPLESPQAAADAAGINPAETASPESASPAAAPTEEREPSEETPQDDASQHESQQDDSRQNV